MSIKYGSRVDRAFFLKEIDQDDAIHASVAYQMAAPKPDPVVLEIGCVHPGLRVNSGAGLVG